MQEPHIDESRSALQKKQWKELFGGNQIAKRLLLALIFFIVLTYFLHFRGERVEVLDIGTLAPRYVIAQTDFSFYDEEATKVLMQEAVRDIGAIYQIDENQVSSFRRAFENTLIEKQQWRQELPRTTFEEIDILLDGIESRLVAARFTDQRTLHRMKALTISLVDFCDIERSLSQTEPIALPSSLWERIERQLRETKHFHQETIDCLMASFSKHLWGVTQDFSLERAIRQKVRHEIPNRYTQLDAGTQIIKKGERVALRHVAMVQAMKQSLDQARSQWTPLTLLGSALIALCLMTMSLLYLNCFHRDFLRSLQKITLLISIVIISFLLAECYELLPLNDGRNLFEMVRFPLILPFASLLICILISSEIATVTSFFLLLVFGAVLTVDAIPFLLINFFASLVTILFARRLHKRKEIFAVCGKVWLSVIPLILAFNLIDNSLRSFNVLIDVISGFLFLSITAIFVVGLSLVLEAIFDVMTDMTLMEYMDPDHELLRRLSLEAPGTYQHCLVLGNISEAAARSIGANGLFCRVSTLYHDIGKLFNPHYFTENQLGGFNIHQLLTPAESTHVIIAHVSEGESLARKYHLPQSFIDIIREHHGTTMVYYFYCKQVEQMGGDATRVHEKTFRYPGPKPRSKESAIIMIADTVEAASRAMDEVTEDAITDMVDKLVRGKAEDGQLDECQLTFEELGRVKRAIIKALMITRHLRIKYPEP